MLYSACDGEEIMATMNYPV